jgi:hypothetical protein
VFFLFFLVEEGGGCLLMEKNCVVIRKTRSVFIASHNGREYPLSDNPRSYKRYFYNRLYQEALKKVKGNGWTELRIYPRTVQMSKILEKVKHTENKNVAILLSELITTDSIKVVVKKR